MTVSSSIGPISGIDYGKLIDGLMGLEQKPLDSVKTQIGTVTKQSDALLGLSALLTGLKVSATNFSSSAVFRATTASSSNTGVLSAIGGLGTPTGSYSFNVQRLATSSQVVTQGFASSGAALGLSGNLTFQFGRGRLDPVLGLADLNGGRGVTRGAIRITDRTGQSATVDLSAAVDVNDILDAINNTGGINVRASIQGDKFVLEDRSGGTGTFSVTNVGAANTASDLGLTAGAATVNGSTLTGADVNRLSAATMLNSLNNGNGVRTAGILDDFSITTSAGNFNVALTGTTTLGDVINKINTAGNINGVQTVTAAISADGHGLTLTGAGGGAVTVAALNGSNAARDLGLTTGTAGAGTLIGDRINAGLNSALLRGLHGGAGVGLGDIAITDRLGNVHSGIDLSGAKTMADVLAIINQTPGVGVTASLNSAGNGILLTDTTGATTGAISVADGATGTAATDLGLAKSVTGTSLDGGDLKLRVLSENTRLSTLNAGAGFKAGKIRLTDSTGASFVVDLSGPTITTVGAVLAQINNASTHIRATINADGNGILLTDTAGGTVGGKVEEVDGGSSAASLGLLGNFVGGTLNGSLQKSISVSNTDTLDAIAKKINDAGLGVAASVINDGSGGSPYRLSLSSRNSGAAGNLLFDGGSLGLASNTLVRGQDAVVVYGGGTGLLSTSSSNSVTGLVPGLTLSLTGTGSASVSVARDDGKITDAVKTFVDNYNKVVANIKELTKFDPDKPEDRGILFGDGTVQQVEQGLGSFLTRIFTGVGSLRTLAGVGITVAQDGTLSLNADKFQSLLATNASDVQALFTTKFDDPKDPRFDKLQGGTETYDASKGGVGAFLGQVVDRFTDASTGLIFRTTDSLALKIRQLNDRSTSLNDLLTAKRARLVRQYAMLEVNIAKLQQQGSALANFKPVAASSSK